ncbi:MAG: hypothetical protein WC601_12280 [Desulfotomaculaceae bacterium]
MIKQKVFSAGEGKYKITLIATITEEGLVAQIFGGEKPHLGAIALSTPRQSLADPEQVSCSTIVIPLPGHKDDQVAKPVAEEIAKAWGSQVLTVVGVHVNNAGEKDIEKLIDNCHKAKSALLEGLRDLK